MSYRSLLVLLDDDHLCHARTEQAIRLAREHDSHLVGLAPTGLVEMPVMLEAAATVAEFANLAWNTLRDRARQAAERFREQCVAAKFEAFEAVVDEAEPAASLVRHAHCTDLTVLSQADPDSASHTQTRATVEQVLLHSARPTLILPYTGRFEHIGQRTMVAWDDSSEATRAVSDALPLLRRAKHVQVTAWNEDGEPDATLHQRLASLQRWLMWQGIDAEIAVETSEIGIAEALLSRSADMDADLIVMGAYGHARWTQRMLGGATRGLLASMTVPVLMSH